MTQPTSCPDRAEPARRFNLDKNSCPASPTPTPPRFGPADEAARLVRLDRLLDHPHLPTPPAVALRVVEKASEPGCSLADIEATILLDPALCGKVLRTVNSALYGLPRSVASIRQALGMLGLNAVRSLVLSLSLPALQGRAVGQSLQDFWKVSVAGAIVARELALRLGWPGPEDHLVAGLLRDLGTLFLSQAFPAEANELQAIPADERDADECEREVELFGVHHAEVSAHVLRRWRLPEEITEAIRYHHHPNRAARLQPGLADRAWLLYFASRTARLQLTPRPPGLLREVFELASDRFGLNEAQLLQFLEPIHHKIEDFASLANVEVGRCEQYPAILASATEELVKLALATSMDNLRVCEERNRAEAEARQWRRAALRIRDEAVRDPLTGCLNRGSFDETMAREFRRARRRYTLLGLVFLDLDGFKTLNDRFGHLFGDQVLKAVATQLKNTVRATDVVARYGGDEFCVIVTNTTEAGLWAMSNRLAQNLKEIAVRHAGHTARVGASIGAVVCMPRHYQQGPGEFLAEADRAMYRVKTSGKNQVTLVSLLGEEDHRLLGEMERRFFSTFLVSRQQLSAQQMAQLPRPVPAPFRLLGRLARQLEWISRPRLGELLLEQRRTRQPFLDLALARGFLSSAQVYGLLALQRQEPECLGQALVDLDVLPEAEVRQELTRYYQSLPTMG